MDTIDSLRTQVAKEKQTSRDNLKKVMRITQEKKEVLEQLAALQSTIEGLNQELESAKEEAMYWQDEVCPPTCAHAVSALT